MIFKTGETAFISGQEYRCIVADEDTAVLGKVTRYRDRISVSYKNAAIYSNQDWSRKHIIGLENIVNAAERGEITWQKQT
jgi:hypothetical protein